MKELVKGSHTYFSCEVKIPSSGKYCGAKASDYDITVDKEVVASAFVCRDCLRLQRGLEAVSRCYHYATRQS